MPRRVLLLPSAVTFHRSTLHALLVCQVDFIDYQTIGTVRGVIFPETLVFGGSFTVSVTYRITSVSSSCYKPHLILQLVIGLICRACRSKLSENPPLTILHNPVTGSLCLAGDNGAAPHQSIHQRWFSRVGISDNIYKPDCVPISNIWCKGRKNSFSALPYFHVQGFRPVNSFYGYQTRYKFMPRRQQGIITTFSIDPLCINATYEGTPPFIHWLQTKATFASPMAIHRCAFSTAKFFVCGFGETVKKSGVKSSCPLPRITLKHKPNQKKLLTVQDYSRLNLLSTSAQFTTCQKLLM